MGIILPKTYFSLKKANDIANICEPLVKRYQLTMFVYVRMFDNGTSYHLTNCLAYQDYYFEKEFIACPPIPNHLISTKFSYFLAPDLYELYGDSISNFALFNPLYLFERYPGFTDMYLFCFKENKYDALNLYLNEMDLFEKFKFYFKDKTLKYLDELQKNKIVMSNTMKPDFMKEDLAKSKESQEEFLHQISIDRYVFDYRGQTLTLTKREYETVKYLRLGYTTKDIAKKIRLSPRTIDDYLRDIKNKLCISRKSKILETILSETNLYIG